MIYEDLVMFFAHGLPSLLAGLTRVHALFVTYNSVDGYAPGKVAVPKEGLTVEIHCGNLEYVSASMMMVKMADSAMVDYSMKKRDDLKRAGTDAMFAQAAGAQQAVERAVQKSITTAGQDMTILAVVYVGIGAYHEAVAYIERLHDDFPGCKVLVVSCNCRLDLKRPKFEELLAAGRIDQVMITPECGGEKTMAQVLEALINLWPVAGD